MKATHFEIATSYLFTEAKCFLILTCVNQVTQRQAQAKLLQAQQHHTTPLPGQATSTVPPTTPSTPARAPCLAKVVRLNGVIQETPIDSNHLPPTGKGKKEPPQPPPAVKLVRNDADDSDSMASSSREFPNLSKLCVFPTTEVRCKVTSYGLVISQKEYEYVRNRVFLNFL